MTPSPAHWPHLWLALPAAEQAIAPSGPEAIARDPHWLPLGQAWRDGKTDAAFQPGWARASWSKTALHYDAIFMGRNPANRARRLNQRTWELGDVGEIFLQGEGDDDYCEIHITPENMRLQLRWTPDGLARVRADEIPLEHFMVPRPDWVESRTKIGPDFWALRLDIPAPALGLPCFDPSQAFRTAVCRYHYPSPEPVVSSTAPLTLPSFHHRPDWHRLLLSPATKAP